MRETRDIQILIGHRLLCGKPRYAEAAQLGMELGEFIGQKLLPFDFNKTSVLNFEDGALLVWWGYFAEVHVIETPSIALPQLDEVPELFHTLHPPCFDLRGNPFTIAGSRFCLTRIQRTDPLILRYSCYLWPLAGRAGTVMRFADGRMVDRPSLIS